MAYDLKNEEDVQLYLENLGIEYRFSCYHEKRPDGCHLLADYLESVKRDFKKAGSVYMKNCNENKHPKSCYKYGNYSLLGRGCTKSEERAYNYFKKGCENGSAEACYHAGLMLTSPKITTLQKDYQQGLKFLEKGCEGNDKDSCYFASSLHFQFAEFLPVNKKRAFELAYKACELGNVYACSNVSLMYKRGDGVEKNETLSNLFRKRATEMQDEFANPQPELKFGE